MKLQKSNKVAIKCNSYRVIYLFMDVPVFPLSGLVKVEVRIEDQRSALLKGGAPGNTG